MYEVIQKFRAWKKEHPDEDYQYDEIHEFIAKLSRGELLSFFDSVMEFFDGDRPF